jgi:hypothetical protein
VSDAIVIAAIAALPPTLVALAALIQARRTRAAVNEIHLTLNSRLSQLIEATSAAAHAEGVVAGRGQERLEANE